MIISCDRCSKNFTPKNLKKIITESGEYYFCLKCLRKAGITLSKKTNRTTQENQLLFQLTKMIKNPEWAN